MPFPTTASIPPDVKARYQGRCLEVWRTAWNSTYDRHQDEGRAFATAELAAKQCKASRSAEVTTVDKAVKFVDGSDDLIEGLAIPFGGPFAGKDLDGEAFGPDTDFAFEWFPQGRPVIYHHGLDEAMKTAVQGRQLSHEITDEGVWARAQLDKSARYHATVAKLIGQGKLFFSSSSQPHLVDTEPDGRIKTWPWVELSLTPTPANPLAVVHPVKSTDILEHFRAASLPVPQDFIDAALKKLDQTADDDALPDGAKFADLIDRVSVDGPAWVKARLDWFAKSGRVLSAATRERLLSHPATLRQLADDLDALLDAADADKREQAKTALIVAALEAELIGNPLAPPVPTM